LALPGGQRLEKREELGGRGEVLGVGLEVYHLQPRT
jgi:hypothetical protein